VLAKVVEGVSNRKAYGIEKTFDLTNKGYRSTWIQATLGKRGE